MVNDKGPHYFVIMGLLLNNFMVASDFWACIYGINNDFDKEGSDSTFLGAASTKGRGGRIHVGLFEA